MATRPTVATSFTVDAGFNPTWSGAITPSGSNRVVYAVLHVTVASTADPVTITCGGSAMTKVASYTDTFSTTILVYRTIGPAASANTVSVDWDGAAGLFRRGGMTLIAVQDVDQTTPEGANNGAGCFACSTTPTIATAADDLILVPLVFKFGDTNTVTPGAGVTTIQDFVANGTGSGAARCYTGRMDGTGGTFGAPFTTGTGDDGSVMIFAVKAVAGGGGGGTSGGTAYYLRRRHN